MWGDTMNEEQQQTQFDKDQAELAQDNVAELDRMLDEAWESMKGELGHFNILKPSTWKFLYKAVMVVVETVENIGNKYGNFSGDKKKQLTVNYLNSKINLPLMGESLEAIIIGAFVDAFVWWLNKTFGHDWGRVFEMVGNLPDQVDSVNPGLAANGEAGMEVLNPESDQEVSNTDNGGLSDTSEETESS